jgi:hypothetical protein
MRCKCSNRHALRSGEIRRIKALDKRPVKAVIERAVLPQRFESLTPAAQDFEAAAHIRDLGFGTDRGAATHVRGHRAGAGTTSVIRRLEPLAADEYRDLVRRALAEDMGRGDITTGGDG